MESENKGTAQDQKILRSFQHRLNPICASALRSTPISEMLETWIAAVCISQAQSRLCVLRCVGSNSNSTRRAGKTFNQTIHTHYYSKLFSLHMNMLMLIYQKIDSMPKRGSRSERRMIYSKRHTHYIHLPIKYVHSLSPLLHSATVG